MLPSVTWRKVRSMLTKELEERPKLGMMKEIAGLELESSYAVLKRKRDRRMMIKLRKRRHGSIADRGGKVARSREEGENVQGMPEGRSRRCLPLVVTVPGLGPSPAILGGGSQRA